MNCEQVEELLSAYLDNELAPEEIAGVTAHLQQCVQCRSILADFRRFDTLLMQLPRVSPSPALHDRIFSSPEYLELTGTFDANSRGISEPNHPTHSTQEHARRDTPGRPHLIAIPGGRSTSPGQPSPEHAQRHQFGLSSSRSRRVSWGLQVMRVAIAVAFLFTIGAAGMIGRNLWLQQTSMANIKGAIPPPAGLQQGPFPVGMRFVFLRDGALWSTPANGSTQPVRLTPATVTVAANWVVSPALPGRSAGDMLAYIDLQHALIHTLRSDGQSDTVIPQPMLKAGLAPSSIWDTDTGAAILNSLTWSKNGNMLAFVGDPNGTGLTNLYILSMDTGSVEMVPLSGRGSASYPVWSPDGVRLAFEFSSGNTVSIMDYNTQNHGLLMISDEVRTPTNPADTVLTLGWSPNLDTPTITWSAGVIGHVHSIWIRRVGVGGTERPQLLASGDYVQAIYSPAGHAGVGSWLFVTSIAGRQGDIWSVDAIAAARLLPLTAGEQVGLAWWSPNGTYVDYLDSISSGLGTLHAVNVTTGIDTLIADGVADEPAPAWSKDSLELAYSTGIQTVIVNLKTGKKMPPLKLQGPASALIWSASSSNQLVIAINDSNQGIYLVDAAQNTSLQVDTQGINGPILWTEIP